MRSEHGWRPKFYILYMLAAREESFPCEDDRMRRSPASPRRSGACVFWLLPSVPFCSWGMIRPATKPDIAHARQAAPSPFSILWRKEMDLSKDTTDTVVTKTAPDARGERNDGHMSLEFVLTMAFKTLCLAGLLVTIWLIIYMLYEGNGAERTATSFLVSAVILVAVLLTFVAFYIVILTLAVRNPQQLGDFITTIKDILTMPFHLLSGVLGNGPISNGHDDAKGGERAMRPELKIEKEGDLSCSDK